MKQRDGGMSVTFSLICCQVDPLPTTELDI